MGKVKRIISILISVTIFLSAVYFPIHTVAQSNGNLLENSTITANNEYYNGWYEYNRPLSALIDGNTYVGVGYNAGNMFATEFSAEGLAYVNFKLPTAITLNKLVVYLAGTSAVQTDVITDYAVDVKLLDESWKRVAEKHTESFDNWDAYVETLCFEEVTVSEVQITIKNAKGQTYASIYEIEALYDDTITSDDYTQSECKDFTEYAIIKPEYENLLKDATEITANEAYYNGWYPDNRSLLNLIDGNTFVGVGYNAGSAAVIPYEDDGQAYINFKLNKESVINKITIHFPGLSAYAKELQVDSYAVEVKSEEEWKRVAVRNIENSDNWDAYSDTVTFNKVECEEIRIIFVRENGQQTLSVFEIEVIADNRLIDSEIEPEEPPETLENLLNDTTEITANESYYNGWYPENRALSNLIDGNTFVGVGYNAGSAAVIPYEVNGDTFVNFKLKKKTTVNQIDIYFPGTSAYPVEQQVKCYVIEVKVGENWERVAVRNIETSENWDAYSDTATFNKVKCEEIRIIFIKSKGQETLSLFEVEAYYNPDITDSDKPLEEIPKAPENILKNANKITANDAYYNGWYPTYRPLSKTIDGDTSFKFDASKATMIPYGSSKLAFIQYDFDKAVKANKLLYYSPDAGDENTMPLTNRLTDYAVDVKLSDGTWKRIIEHHSERVEDWDIYYDEYLFETVEFVSLRFVSKSVDDKTYLAISELELNYDTNELNKEPYMNRYVSNKLTCTSKNIKNAMFGTQKEIEMPIVSVISGIIPTTGLGDNSWYKTERPLKNITDGIQDVFTPANISTIDYHDNVAYYNFALSGCKKINTVRFFVPQKDLNAIKERPTDFAVDVMLRDGTWKRVAEKHIAVNKDEAGYCETITFETEECMQIRLTSVSNGKMSYFALSEVEAYLNTYLTKEYTGIEKAPSLEKEVPNPKIRLVPIAKFN